MPTPSEVVVRRLEPTDAAAADAVAWAALRPLVPEGLVPDEDGRQRWVTAKIAHVAGTDPDGGWVAEAEGEVVGMAQALVRDGLWGLSQFGVAPRHQGQGLGLRLLERCLAGLEGMRGGLIAASTDPRALRRYVRAGFDARPCLEAAGPVNASRIPDGLRSRPGDAESDRATIERVGRACRGAAHGWRDLALSCAHGAALLVHDDDGFALHRAGGVVLVAALDEAAAEDLLWSCFAAAGPGATTHISFVPPGNDWALRAALDAGLTLGVDGPVMVRGDAGPLRPYVPSGVWL